MTGSTIGDQRPRALSQYERRNLARQEVLRDNFARQDIGSLAALIGQLRRFHYATLPVNLTLLIKEIVTDTPNTLLELERTGDDWSAARVIRAQFPDVVWQALVHASLHTDGGERDIQLIYTWNSAPTEPASIIVRLAGQDDTIIAIAGLCSPRMRPAVRGGGRSINSERGGR